MTWGQPSKTSTNGIRIRGRSTISTTISGAGKTRTGAAPTSTCSGRTSRIQKRARSSSPAAEHRRRRSTPPAVPAARVVGIDFSATSVRHTEDLRRKYNLTNLDVHQLPIDRVGDLAMTFDEIVCTGVLHHLTNPDAALRALRDVLDPDGAMHLMVYAPYGRAGIYMLQEFCRGIGIQASDDEIRDLIAALVRVAVGTSVSTPAARGPGLPSRGGAGRRAVASAGSRVFSAAASGLHRRRRTHVQPLGQTGAVQSLLRVDSGAPAGIENRSARTGKAVCRCRIISRDDGEPQCHRPPRRSPWPLAREQLFRR